MFLFPATAIVPFDTLSLLDAFRSLLATPLYVATPGLLIVLPLLRLPVMIRPPLALVVPVPPMRPPDQVVRPLRSEERTSELQSHSDIVCGLLLELKKVWRPPMLWT